MGPGNLELVSLTLFLLPRERPRGYTTTRAHCSMDPTVRPNQPGALQRCYSISSASNDDEMIIWLGVVENGVGGLCAGLHLTITKLTAAAPHDTRMNLCVCRSEFFPCSSPRCPRFRFQRTLARQPAWQSRLSSLAVHAIFLAQRRHYGS